jgi:NMD protein affecting ribosome stability and mRNA decay
MSKEYYDKLKEKGLCVRCCNKQAENGHVMCKECLEITRKVSKENFDWYQKNGYCYRCGKEKVFGDEKTCPECRAKNYIALSRSVRKRYGNAHNYYLDRRTRYLAEGRCVRCGKKAEQGLKYCRSCLDKTRERNRKDRLLGKTVKDIPRSERFSYGLCYRCGKPLDTDKRLCSACCISAGANFHGRHGKKHWKADNEFVFGGVAHG